MLREFGVLEATEETRNGDDETLCRQVHDLGSKRLCPLAEGRGVERCQTCTPRHPARKGTARREAT